MVVLQRHDDGAGVEAEHLGEVGAAPAPLLSRRDGLLLQIGEHVAGAVDFHARHEARGRIDRASPEGYVNWCTFSAHGAA